MQNGSRKADSKERAAGQRQLSRAREVNRALPALLITALFLGATPAWAAPVEDGPPLPDAPQPQHTSASSAAAPCPATAKASQPASTQPGTPTAGTPPPSCLPHPEPNWYERFINGPDVKPMTRREKARLAARNVADPFNALTILGASAIAVGADADSPYGPGMKGFGRYVGVSYTQDITGEFFGTFLIPSIVHQDPHYHRMPTASIPRRAVHCIAQVVWTQGDNGRGMVNYADVAGFALDDEIANLYVPGRQTNLPSSGERYATGLASAPIENFVIEFLPDIARRIHIRVLLIQRIVNRVANTPGSGSP
ncbi:MAG: hypothetical protein ABR991_09895 [Terracidiphilus sp.]